MAANHIDDDERRITRRSVLKAGLVASAVGIGGAATGGAQPDDDPEKTGSDDDTDGDTHTLTIHLIESEDADPVSGDVTVDGQTKPTTGDDPRVSSAEFELEDGTYTVSGTSDAYPDWRTNDREITIEGGDRTIELYLFPPGSDELEDDDPDTPTLTVTLVESREADIVSGEVSVNGQTKTTTPDVRGDPAIIQAEFELEDGTYTVSGTWDRGEIWRTNEQELTIDGEDESLSLLLYPPGADELEDDDAATHTLTVSLVESEDADIVSGDVTVDGQTKPTTGDDPHYSSAEFELEDGTYTVRGTSDLFPDWRTNEREVTIDGADTSLELYLFPPGSDELEETELGDDESQDGSVPDEKGSDGSGDTDHTSEETDAEEDDEKSFPSDESGDTDLTDQKQAADNCP